jgi:hypothetical protein
MKKILLTILAITVIASISYAQNGEKKNPNAPVITFEKLIHNYGTIQHGSSGICEFKFTNTGKEPLILQRPRSSCGCTIPTWPKQPIMPGKSAKIKVTYDTKRIGPINKSVTILSNARNRAVILKIKGRVIK